MIHRFRKFPVIISGVMPVSPSHFITLLLATSLIALDEHSHSMQQTGVRRLAATNGTHIIGDGNTGSMHGGGTGTSPPIIWSGWDINIDVFQSFCLLCTSVHMVYVIECYNCLFTGQYYQTRTESGPGYSRTWAPNFAID